MIKLLVIQVHDNEKCKIENCKKRGKGYYKAYRLNPFNPLSYLFAVLALIVALIMFGVVGMAKETDGNPFKWN